MYSSVDVPILHKDWHGEYSLSAVFLNPKLMGVSLPYFIPTFWETDSLLSSMSLSFVGLPPERILWMVNYFTPKPRRWLRFTPGAIATCGILVCCRHLDFLHS
jgi:hypothetical protein